MTQPKYRFSNNSSALNEVEQAMWEEAREARAAARRAAAEEQVEGAPLERSHLRLPAPAAVPSTRMAQAAPNPRKGYRWSWGLWVIVEDGARILLTRSDGRQEVVTGPATVWAWGAKVEVLAHYVAHPGEFLVVRRLDGTQEHRAGPADLWFEPRVHAEVTVEEGSSLASKEAVVAYTPEVGSGGLQRRILVGPCTFIPEPGEWLHNFSRHGSRRTAQGVQKVPNALQFQKLWRVPDHMYHDVPDVRTADDAMITVRLMFFFELVDIERMLDATHDPIGVFVNATTADVIDFIGRRDFAAFKQSIERDQRDQDLAQEARLTAQQKALEREHLAELTRLGVDLTALLTAVSPNRVIELRGGAGAPHLEG